MVSAAMPRKVRARGGMPWVGFGLGLGLGELACEARGSGLRRRGVAFGRFMGAGLVLEGLVGVRGGWGIAYLGFDRALFDALR